MSSSKHKNRSIRIENLESRQMFAADLGAAAAGIADASDVPVHVAEHPDAILATLGDTDIGDQQLRELDKNKDGILGWTREESVDVRFAGTQADAADQIWESFQPRGLGEVDRQNSLNFTNVEFTFVDRDWQNRAVEATDAAFSLPLPYVEQGNVFRHTSRPMPPGAWGVPEFAAELSSNGQGSDHIAPRS